MLPNFIIAGAQKSGTTTLHGYLRQHPDCLMSMPKEPAYFSRLENLSSLEAYHACFRAPRLSRPPRVVGEATTAYLFETYAPERIRATLGPDVRLVFILRDPVERAISAYWHTYKTLVDQRPLAQVFGNLTGSISECCAQEADRLASAAREGTIQRLHYQSLYDDYRWPFRYLRNSCYTEALQRFDQVFPRASMHVLLFEDLLRDPDRTLHELEEFLGIEQRDNPRSFLKHANKTLVPDLRFPRLPIHRLAVSSMGVWLRRRYRILDHWYRQLLMREKPKCPEDISGSLRRAFLPELAKLGSYLGRDLSEVWGRGKVRAA